MKTKNQIAILMLALCGCGPKPDTELRVRENTPQPPQQARISVARVGVISDGLAYNGRRGIYIITDSKTGKEFIGVSGIGISELGMHSVGKQTYSDER